MVNDDKDNSGGDDGYNGIIIKAMVITMLKTMMIVMMVKTMMVVLVMTMVY